MSRFQSLASLLSVSLLVCSVSAQEPSKPWKPTKDTFNIFYSGKVTDVTKNSITVEWPGESPKFFPASETLSAGGIPKEPRTDLKRVRPYTVDNEFRYRLQDIKVGDVVVIAYAHVGDADICDHICIRQRPGGRIPPLPEGAVTPRVIPGGAKGFEYLLIPYHETMNAYWDLEERGIPYPEKFGPNRRFYPTAPWPREVKPKP